MVSCPNLGKHMRTLFVVGACIGDEISDILFITKNWQKFNNDGLKYSSLFFVCFNYLVNLIIACYFYRRAKGIQNLYHAYGPCILIYCCVGPLSWILMSLILWTKTIELIFHCGLSQRYFVVDSQQGFGIVEIKKYLILLGITQLVFEDIPMIIIQIYHNVSNNDWNTLQIICITFSVLAILGFLLKLLFVANINTNQQESQDQINAHDGNGNDNNNNHGNGNGHGNANVDIHLHQIVRIDMSSF